MLELTVFLDMFAKYLHTYMAKNGEEEDEEGDEETE